MAPMKKLPPAWLIKTFFVVLSPFFAVIVLSQIIAAETAHAWRCIYFEIRIEIASARNQWRSLS